MAFNERDIGLLAAGAAFTVLVLFVAWNETDTGQPRYAETFSGNDNPNLATVLDRLDTGDHYFHVNHCVPGQGQVFTPHRYPHISGANITALIHGGFDSMRKAAPQDDDWRTRPPGEVMWLCLNQRPNRKRLT
jgi:hypothetical protein